MANPRHRHSRTRGRKRQAHDALKTKPMTECPHCHEMKLPHRVCPACGYYRGRQIIEGQESI